MHISVFPVSRVALFHVEGDATVDKGDAWLIGQTVIDKSRPISAIHVSFVPCSILPYLKHNKPNQLPGSAEIKDAIWWNNNKFWHMAW